MGSCSNLEILANLLKMIRARLRTSLVKLSPLVGKSASRRECRPKTTVPTASIVAPLDNVNLQLHNSFVNIVPIEEDTLVSVTHVNETLTSKNTRQSVFVCHWIKHSW